MSDQEGPQTHVIWCPQFTELQIRAQRRGGTCLRSCLYAIVTGRYKECISYSSKFFRAGTEPGRHVLWSGNTGSGGSGCTFPSWQSRAWVHVFSTLPEGLEKILHWILKKKFCIRFLVALVLSLLHSWFCFKMQSLWSCLVSVEVSLMIRGLWIQEAVHSFSWWLCVSGIFLCTTQPCRPVPALHAPAPPGSVLRTS